jgi:DNA polymerase-3 subunit chi
MKVDFYVFEDSTRMQALHELCLLIEAPYHAKETIYIYTASTSDADQLDNLLWTYQEDSFLAHQLTSENPELTSPVLIGPESPTAAHNNVLVNLSGVIPEFYRQFKRVIEIVYADPSVQQAARDRFRQYREQGCDIQTHKMKVNAA